MSEADKLFKELNYINVGTIKEPYTLYETLIYIHNEKFIRFEFNLINKEITKACGTNFDRLEPITIKELKAINTKVKELGWLDEKI